MKPDLMLRAVLTLSGALAGLAAWLLGEYLPDHFANFRVLMTLAVFTGLFFSVFLVATGPLKPLIAAAAALLIAAPSSLLFLWASLRYADPIQFVESGLPLVALLAGTAIAVPFTITAFAKRAPWSDYATLFNEAWNLFTRSTAALVFTGIVWAVILLSDQLLRLVGLTFIADLLELDVVPALLTGAAFGLALAVVHELSAYVTPYLILRLLRLLLPLVLVVSAIFVVALPFRGLGELFGRFSSAFVLMSIAFGGMTLVTTAIDRTDDDGVDPGWMRLATRALALLVAVLAGLAVWSVMLRVGQYGWTPDRLAAMCAALVLFGYGLSYAVAVLRGARWMHLIRRANVWMALVTMAIAALWLTPLLNAERISVVSQMARLESGKVSVADFDLWSVGRDWGRAGEVAVERLRVLSLPEQAALNTRLDGLAAAEYRWDFEGAESLQPVQIADPAGLVAGIAVLPAGARLPDALLASDDLLRRIEPACARKLASGKPACVAVQGDFLTAKSGDEWLLVYQEYDQSASVTLIALDGAGLRQSEGQYLSLEALERIAAGDYQIAPPDVQLLRTGGETVTPQP